MKDKEINKPQGLIKTLSKVIYYWWMCSFTQKRMGYVFFSNMPYKRHMQAGKYISFVYDKAGEEIIGKQLEMLGNKTQQ